MRASRAPRWRLRRMLFPSSDGYRVRACTHKIAIGDSGLINVRLGPLCRLKSDISRGPRSCHEPTFSPNGRYGISWAAYSGLMLAVRTTLPHFSVSSAMSLPKSVVEPTSGVLPKSASCALIFGSASAVLISLLSLSMTSVGVLLGEPTPDQPLAS